MQAVDRSSRAARPSLPGGRTGRTACLCPALIAFRSISSQSHQASAGMVRTQSAVLPAITASHARDFPTSLLLTRHVLESLRAAALCGLLFHATRRPRPCLALFPSTPFLGPTNGNVVCENCHVPGNPRPKFSDENETKSQFPNSPSETPCTMRVEKKSRKEKWITDMEKSAKTIPPWPAGCLAR